MNLFTNAIDERKNYLPKDGIVNYYGKIFSDIEANYYLTQLYNAAQWENDAATIYGKLIITKRKVAWYGDHPFSYSYSGHTKKALPWIKELKDLKQIVEEKSNEKFNSCLLNLYHNGEEGMSWHSDAEKELKKNGAIASLSFGAERNFYFKHKIDKNLKVSILLEHGSLLVMKDTTQTNWLHSLPIQKKISNPRINLTFRSIVF